MYVQLSGDARAVRSLREAHDSLLDAAALVDQAYGVPLLGSLAANFVHFISALNLMLAVKLRYQVISHGHADFLILISSCWALLHVICVLAVTGVSSAAAAETRQIPRLVHKALLPITDVGTSDAQLREQLQLFSQQVMHQRLCFTACGFFTIDLTIVLSMVGAVTTYLVIYLQFSATH
ncbi:putative gustatory receptor 28b [Schistocerca piceifrons]|uniref:putative gustatory receptor 28b n=1 Tax=Schistocerca piceifrons TaxID=274613 RepID=UPI001F5F8532|nr:putative gustatory receptor 28b [Schistocerca piceifrons]